jgi:hypothetical protein
MIPHARPTMGDIEAAAAAAVIHSGQLAQGRQVEAFEAEVDLPPHMYPHPELGCGCEFRFDDHRCGWPIS